MLLFSRVNRASGDDGVQEAGSSNLLTQTTQEHSANRCAPCFVGGEKRMTIRDAHVRSLNFSPARSATDASLRSVCLPAFLLTPPPFSRPFAVPSLRSLQIFSPRPKRRGLNSSATLSSENSFSVAPLYSAARKCEPFIRSSFLRSTRNYRSFTHFSSLVFVCR